MATCIPDKLDPDTPESERRTFAALRRLPDPWRVFHSVAWQSARSGKEGDGEADFVLLHPDRGIHVIEVKGGDVTIRDGQWFSFDGHNRHRIKNPYEQATDSKHALVRYLRSCDETLPFLEAGHAVVFPSLTSVEGLGALAPADITLDRSDMGDIDAAVQRLTDHWGSGMTLTAAHIDTITALLAPTTAVRRLFRDDVAEAAARLLLLTKDQVGVLDGLRRNRRAIIYGGAGTGKTVLAAERARRLAAEGSRVLLTCFNKPLAEHLHTEFAGSPVTVHHFHSLCRWQIGAAGHAFPDDPPREWWDEGVASALIDAADETGLRFDAVVVDEGQDFAPPWFVALQALLEDPDDGPFYVFADSHQAIYREEWEPPFPGPAFDLTTNCRNTLPIAGRVAAVFGDPVATLGAPGPEPEFLTTETAEAIPRRLGNALDRMVNKGGLRSDQVVVLTQHREQADRLRGRTAAGVRLVPPGGSGVVVETIHRFKGLEADVVVLVLDELDDAQDRSLAYIGMSRARAHLIVTGPPEVGAELGIAGRD